MGFCDVLFVYVENGYFCVEEVEEFVCCGVVGDVFGCYVDVEGNIVDL